jgi:hypothetical protein
MKKERNDAAGAADGRAPGSRSLSMHRRPGQHGRRRCLATVVVGLMMAAPWLVGTSGASAGAAPRPSTEEHRPPADASRVTHAAHRNGHAHKAGPVAVIFSVIGVIVVVVLIVFLGSLSARRRMPYRSGPRNRGERGPPEPRRGLFG